MPVQALPPVTAQVPADARGNGRSAALYDAPRAFAGAPGNAAQAPAPTMTVPSIRKFGLQARIVALFVAMMVLAQGGGFLLINTAGVAAARKTIGDELDTGERVFHRLLEQRTVQLVQGARILSADFAFREAIASKDRATIVSVLHNHGERINASYMMLLALDGRVLADTRDSAATMQSFPHPRLLTTAEREGRAAAMIVLDGVLYQLVVVPVLAPLPIAWVAMGFAVNDAFTSDLSRLTGLQVSFAGHPLHGNWSLKASTLDASLRASFDSAINRPDFGLQLDSMTLGGQEYLTRVVAVEASDGDIVLAALQEQLESALAPFRRLQHDLAWFSLIGIIVCAAASVLIAGGIARPVRELARVARRIAGGDYSHPPPAISTGEIGDLTTAFRSMQEGLAARESRILELAYRDMLTGLPNRALFADRLQQALSAAGRSGTPMGVLLMDVDHFKYVNDTLGHQIGDLMLREMARRLTSVVRRDADTVARLGGDEFVVLLPAVAVEGARTVARQILAAFEAPMTLEGHLVDCRVSVGIASFPEHGDTTATLLRHADVAMYTAKRNQSGVEVYDPRYDAHGRERLSLMTELRRAVEQDELTLVYQPKVALTADGEQHLEALVRWRHPVRGMVPPADFIPFAEQTGYIRVITEWVLDHAIAQCALWRTQDLRTCVSVNLSTRDLLDPELADRFARLLHVHDCAATWIVLEITESAILDDPGHALANLNRLRQLGCRISIDDYGTGYSSLAYLKQLPVNELKIDQSFVRGLTRDATDAVIVRSTIDLGHQMGLTVVAEGVEDEATLRKLRDLGCDFVQGYHLSRPLAAEAVVAWMRGSVWTRGVVAQLALVRAS